ncbi:MAG TPA: hypothetical protein VFC99_03605 [Acidimicrobiia bacterium]|nr:hypothetical protein [Acidimicrobiia bacterium]
MANPDPKALQAAAAAMRDQAQTARQAFVSEQTRQERELDKEQEEAVIQKHGAEQLVKDRETLLNHYRESVANATKLVEDDQKKIADAERRGDGATGQEAREHQANVQASLVAEQSRLDEARHNLDDARVAVGERTRDLDDVHQRMHQFSDRQGAAEKQLDAMEDKAKLLGEAGRKLELATTIDDPVERANVEVDAENLLKSADAIQIDTAAIVTMTGQDVQLPDIGALPTQPADAPSTDGDAAPAGGDSAPADAGATDGDAAPTGEPGHLDDEFAVATAPDGNGAAPAATGAGTVSSEAGALDTANAAPVDDVLGVGADATAAGPTGSFDASEPLDDAAVATAAPAGDGGVDTFAAQPDPAPDAMAAPADAAATVPDLGDDFSSVASDDAPAPTEDLDA